MAKRAPPKVKNKGQTRAFYVLSSQRQVELFKVRSKLEYRACLHFEVHQGVERFDYEPETFTIPWRRSSFSYTPDFRVQLEGERLLYVEVKYTRDLGKGDLKERLDAWRMHKPHYADFTILTEERLGDVYESNCLFVSKHGHRFDQGEDDFAAYLASLSGPLACVSDLLEVMPTPAEALRFAAVLHWRGLATLDLTHPLGPKTALIWRQACESDLKKASN